MGKSHTPTKEQKFCIETLFSNCENDARRKVSTNRAFLRPAYQYTTAESKDHTQLELHKKTT